MGKALPAVKLIPVVPADCRVTAWFAIESADAHCMVTVPSPLSTA